MRLDGVVMEFDNNELAKKGNEVIEFFNLEITITELLDITESVINSDDV